MRSNNTRTIPAPPTYGDGSNNEVDDYYNNRIYVGNDVNPYTSYYTYWENRNCRSAIQYRLGQITGVSAPVAAEYFNQSASGSGFQPVAKTFDYDFPTPLNQNRTIMITFTNTDFSYNQVIGGFKLKIGGVLYTLNEAIAAGFIEPLLLMGAHNLDYLGFMGGGNIGPSYTLYNIWFGFRVKSATITGISVYLACTVSGGASSLGQFYEYDSTISLTRVGTPIAVEACVNALFKKDGGLVNL
jgi:hypothetical protein